MLKSSLCDYIDGYILFGGTITVVALSAGRGNNSIAVGFKICAPFTDCIREINNTQIDNAKDVDVIMPMQNLIENSGDYSKTSESLWQYYKDEPAFNNGVIANFPGNSVSFKVIVNFFFYIYNLCFFQQKIHSHQVLIYLNAPGISVRKPLQNRQIAEEQLEL